MKKNWSISRIYRTFSIVTAVVLLIFMVSLFYAYKIIQGLNERVDKRYQSYQLADELRQSSDDLTRMARTFVTSGDEKYEQAYLDILAIRNGQKTRPEKYNIIYWDIATTGNEQMSAGTIAVPLRILMQNVGFTEEEFAKLQEAQNNSDDLVKTETIAMNAIKDILKHSSDSSYRAPISKDSAIAMMHGADYHQYKYKIMKPIKEFFEMLDKRTLSEVEEYQKKNTAMIFLLVVFPIVIFGLLITFYLTMRKRVIIPIENLNHQSQIIAQGEFGDKIEIMHNDEIGNLSHAINQVSKGMAEKSLFINEIGKANLDVQLTPLSDKDSMGYALLEMRKNLQKISQEERKRNWTTEGLAKFAELLRKNGTMQETFDTVLSELVKYMNANQGNLYVVNNDNEKDVYLELLSSYAWGRKKHNNERIDKGEGLAGQCWVEGEIIYMKNIPENYIKIKSGLGESLPSCVVILPLKANDEIYGILELASFDVVEAHENEFLLKVSESIASVLATSKVATRTKELLAQTTIQAEEMRAQEEEMRQNMEELSATQEEMTRKEREYLKRIKELEAVHTNGHRKEGNYIN